LFFYWKDGPFGKLWISRRGLTALVERFLPGTYRCADLFFDGETSELTLSIEVPGDNIAEDAKKIEDDLACELSLLGIGGVVVSIVKVEEGKGFENFVPRKLCKNLNVDKPLFWALIVGGVSAVWNLGIKGLIYVAVWAGIGYLASFFLLSDEGKKLIFKVLSLFRRKK